MPYNFNRLYEGMVPFHNGFRQKLRMLEMATPGSQGAAKSNVLNLIRLALSLCEHLEMHHMIEERHIFGHLAKRLPQFESGKTHEAEHAHMHAALEEMEEYLRASSKKLSSSKGALPPPAPMPIAASDGDAAGEGGERGVDRPA
ncbi:Haemerythrin/HHE cation-binding motif [Ceraceosorus bombacis]|uniref:Haemerythrin/HHE cation-binding motif n=1 Tax=Ceraceosorus bombacis TaxID=401625 RepID=A0A0N7LBA5_9BASI|nr:Haemerythrin/HHE cation-binding motif [Ceraceosorus bombacis]